MTNINQAAAEAVETVEAMVVTTNRWSAKRVGIYAALGLVAVGAAVGAAYLLTRKNNAVVAAAVEQMADVVVDATADAVDVVVEAV